MPLDKPIVSYVATPLSYRPDELRFGFSNQEENLAEQKRNRLLISGCNRLFKLQKDFYQGYSSSRRVSVAQVRDLFISICVGKINRCTQTRDSTLTQLTTHCDRWWQANTNLQVWPNLPAYDPDAPYNPEGGFYSVLGTLAFYMYLNEDPGSGLNPLDLVDRTLAYFWVKLSEVADDIGLLITETPASRMQALGNYIGLSISESNAVIQELDQVYNTRYTPPNSAPDYYKILKRNLILPTDWLLLRKRIFAGEYLDSLIQVIPGLEIENLPDFPAITNRVLSIAPPCGLSLVYLALAVEGMSKFARLLANQSDLNLEYSQFIQQMPESLKQEALKYLSLSYDAWGRLAEMNLLYEAAGFTQRIYAHAAEIVLSSQLAVYPDTGDYRLTEVSL